LAIFYLYKKKNVIIMRIIASQYKPPRSELKRDTRTQDWFLLIALIAVVIVMGFKLVTFVVVISNSMTPEFERGDMILTQSFSLIPNPGDIITFHVEGERNAISHRVVKVSGKGIIKTRGDNNGYDDEYKTRQQDVIAKAIMFDNHPVVIKGFGALFITDYKAQGVIFKWGDQFTFMQKLSATIKTWGLVITVVAILAYIVTMKK
jgi:signal peptidase I